MATKEKYYSGWHLLFDFLFTFLTGGIWLIWIFIRFLRSK